MNGCAFLTPDVDHVIAAVMLDHHLTSAHQAPTQIKVPIIPQPMVIGSINEEFMGLLYKGVNNVEGHYFNN